MIKEFKEFLLEGDLVEVAIGLILALYVKTVVDSLVADIITADTSARSSVSRTSVL
jgi:large-conductance mechanosensitive channel